MGSIRTTDTYVKYYHATIENRESILDSGSRIEYQLPFERYCITKLGLAEGEETNKSFKVLFFSLAKPQLKMTVIQNQGKCSRVWNAEQIWLISARDSETVQMFLRSLSPFIAIAESCKVAGLQCNFWVCGRNPAVWPFKWNLSGRTFTWYYLFVCLFLLLLLFNF